MEENPCYMAAQDELFQLIKALTPSEKRYFKVNASKGGDAKSNYMQLFEAMDAQKEEYDEQKLKTKHSKNPFVKYLSAEKKQLREHIMKWMRAYRADSTVDNKINDLLQDEAFYRDKGLKAQREKAILKAKELATKYERFHLLQEVLEKEIKYVEEFEEKSLTEPVLKLINELKELSINQQTFLDLWTIGKEIFAAYRSGVDIKESKVKNRLNSAIAKVESLRTRLDEHFLLKHIFYSAFFDYHTVLRNHEEAFHYCELQYNLYQKESHFKDEYPLHYKICIANFISRAQLARKTKTFLELIREMKRLPSFSFNEEGEVFQNVYFLEHLHYINSGEFDKAEKLIPVIEKGLNLYAKKINKARQLTFTYNIMVMYFLMHQFKEALTWADKILSEKSELKQGISTTTRILYPIMHYELGHHDLVETLTRSAYRHLKGKERIHSFESLMIKYLNQMPFAIDEAEFESKLKTFHHKLTELYNRPESTKTFGMEEVKLWGESKLSGETMQSLIASDQ